MKIAITLLLFVSTVNSIPVSLRFIFMPKLFNEENVNHENPHYQPEFTLQSRSDSVSPPVPFSFVEPEQQQQQQSNPIGFAAQPRIGLANPPFIPMPDPSTSTLQRRMDADEELLSQMPFSPQRRMDEEVMEPQEMLPPIPFVPITGREMRPGPIPFLVRMPMPSNDQQQQQHQQPFISVNQPEARPPIHLQLPIQTSQIQMRAFPIVSQPNLEDEETINEDVDPEQEEQQDEGEEMGKENPINVRSQRILVIESAQRLRPVVLDSLQTVMKIFNAIAPSGAESRAETTTKEPEVNDTIEGDVGKVVHKLDRSLEMLTMQVADALGTLTAHAKQMLPMFLKGNSANVTSGIVEDTTAEVRADEPVANNEIKMDEVIGSVKEQNLKNVTDTVSRFVQLNSDEFRRTWKHFLHHYWTYVQKILEKAQ